MTIKEFSEEFDVLYNNITSNQAPGLDEYEKSIFLTQAQADIVRKYFDPKSNKVQEGFDGSIKRQYDFSSLIKTKELTLLAQVLGSNIPNKPILLSNDSIPYLSPNKVFLIVNEMLIDNKTNERYMIVPLSYKEYFVYKSKPYGKPLKRQAWRLITNDASYLSRIGYYYNNNLTIWFISIASKPITLNVNYTSTSQAPIIKDSDDKITITLNVKSGEMVTYWNQYLQKKNAANTELMKYILPLDGVSTGSWASKDLGENISIDVDGTINDLRSLFEIEGKFNTPIDLTYKIRYIEELKPIILVDLSDEDLTIKGYNTVMSSELPLECHEEILKRAVELAKAAYVGDINTALALSGNSSTDIGYVTSNNSKNQ